jgi:hypothetical protein
MTAIAKEASQRYQSAHELYDALAPFDHSAPAPGSGTALGVASTGLAAPPPFGAAAPPSIDARDPSTAGLSVRPPSVAGAVRSGWVRLRLVVYALLGAPAAIAAMLLAIASAAEGAGILLGVKGWIVVSLGLAFVLSPLLVMGIVHVVKIWSSQVPAQRLMRRVRASVIFGAAAYAFGSVARRWVELVLEDPQVVEWPLWDAALVGLALLVALIASFTASKPPT